MNQVATAGLMVLFAAGSAFAEPTGYWKFEDGPSSQPAASLVSTPDRPALNGKAGIHGNGTPPLFDAQTVAASIWDGASCGAANSDNRLALRFENDASKAGAPTGGQIVVCGTESASQPEDFTVETFVKMDRQMPHHALLVSKRRQKPEGASWSLSITPQGRISARFDTQPESDGNKTGFNQSFGSTGNVADGQWHHVALTYDHASRKADIYVDYVRCGGGVTAATLVYDAGDLIFGRGLDGWLDEVRLTGQVLHPEQFLRAKRFFSDMKPPVRNLEVALDQTPTRVQSALKPELKRIGTLKPKSVPEIGTSMWSLGCETLDRDLASWSVYRGYLVPLGIKRVRVQGGWNRTEKKKGEYDFEWLDRIVDDAISLGLEVCLETSYNNRLYEPGGATGPGGRLPEGEETLAAWDRWVEAMVRRYSPKGVKEWMMYNEPNLNKANTLELIVANNVRTAEIIKRVDPEAKIGAFVLAGLQKDAIKTMLELIKAQGKLDLFHWAIYHGYSGNPDRLNERMAEFTAMLAQVAPKIKPWQGEAGCASEEVQYALSGIDWTEYSHAKWNARRMLSDVGHGIESSVFTISDLAYQKDFVSRYGLLKTNPDNSIIKVKTAYYTVQNVATLFNDALERVPDYSMTIAGTEKELTWFAFRDKTSGLDAVTLWDGTEIPSNASEIETVQVTVRGGRFKDPVWVDLITGNIYAIPPEHMAVDGETVVFKDIPVYDGPAAITDRSLLDFVPARERKGPKRAPAAQTKKKTAATDAPKMEKHLLPGTQQPAPAVLILGKQGEETSALAKWLNAQEIHAFVLATDAGRTPDEVLRAASNALRYIRSRAAEWQVKADAVGVLSVGPEGTVAARVTDADFGIVLDAEIPDPAPPLAMKKRLFVGKSDGWQSPLAAWLEQYKGKVF